jgi:hypothetical protein
MGAPFWVKPRRERRGLKRVAATLTALALAGGMAGTAQASSPASAPKSKPAASSASGGSAPLTQAQAQARAEATGKPVPIPAATTANSTLTALPDGRLQLTDSLSAQRARVDGVWQPLDATLTKNADGTYSPKVSADPVRISGGGPGALAKMSQGGASMTLSLPSTITTLPTPTLAGATATYANVLPGVNLIVTVDDLGGFSEVFEVASAQAAANPALAQLVFPVSTGGGVRLSADAAGNLSATTGDGRTVFHAPVPEMWDSATSAAATASAVTDPQDGVRVDKTTGDPVASSARSPGVAAHVARLGVALSAGRLSLSTNVNLLRGSGAKYPVFIDPSYSQGSDANNWTYTSSEYNTAKNWDISTSDDYLHAGYINSSYDSDDYTSNDIAYFQYNLSGYSNLYGSTVSAVTFYTTDEWSDSCTAEQTDLYATGAISSNTSASNAPTWGSQLENQTFAHGEGSGCPAAEVPWTSTALTSTVQSAATASSGTLTLALRADQETNPLTWRKFDQATAELSITYDKAPYTPTATDMSTSPASSCQGTSGNPIGLGDVSLYTAIGSPMGTQNPLQYEFQVWKGSSTESSGTLLDSTSFSPSVTGASGSTVSLQLLQSQFTSSTWTNGSLTEFYWDMKVYDSILSSQWSTTCDFYYDPTIPGGPSFTDSATQCGTGSTIGTAGTDISFPVAYNLAGAEPAAYEYQLNNNVPVTEAATGGDLTITVDPTRRFNTLTVTSISSGGNTSIGQPTPCEFTVTAPSTAVDKDMTGDGTPDLVLTGQQAYQSTTYPAGNPGSGNPETSVVIPAADTSAVDAGLWQAPGIASSGSETDGQVQTTAADIGADGDGTSATANATSFNGYQAVTGQFTDDGFTDVLLYNPELGQGQVLAGNGDGSTLQAGVSGNEYDIIGGSLSAFDANSDAPLQVANAYNAASDDYAYPDLIAVNGDSTVGFYLDYYESNGAPGVYGQPAQLGADTPDSTMDWQDWTIASDSQNGNLNLLLWNRSTGALYEWYDTTLTSAGVLDYTSYELSSGFDTGQTLAALQITNTGTTAGSGGTLVWAVSTGGTSTPTLFTNLSTTATATATAGIGDPLQTTAHSWALNDGTSGNATTAADGSGGDPLTGSGSGVAWNTGSLFSPDAVFNGAGALASSTSNSTGGALNLAASFTVSAWALPTAYGGAIISQLGSSDVGMTIRDDSSGWYFSLNTTGGTANSYDTITGGAVQLGTWAQITATYNHSNNITSLYVNGSLVATGIHTAPATGAGGSTDIGFDGSDYFTGQVAQVQTWNTVQSPTPAPAHTWALNDGSGTTAVDSVDGDNLSITNGAGWTTSTSPDLTFDGSNAYGYPHGYAQSATPPVNLTGNYTISAWVDLFNLKGAALSINGTDDSALMIYPTSTGWDVGLNTGGTTSATYSTLVGTSALTDENWTDLTFTYNAQTGVGELYVDGVPNGTITDTSPPTVSGSLLVGANQAGAVIGSTIFDGAVGDVQTWNAVVPPEADIALNATATASTTFSGLSTATAVNGEFNYMWSSSDPGSPSDSETYEVNLGSVQPVGEVDLTPRQEGLCFPSAFTIATSTNGSTWTTQVSKSGYNTTGAGTGNATQRFGFNPVAAQYILVTATTLTDDNNGNPYLQLNQLTAYAVADGPTVAYSTWNTELSPGTDLALDQSSSASSTISGWATSNAVNGEYNATWSSTDPGAASDPEWYEVNLGSSQTVDEVDLAARAPSGYCFPSGFEIETSTNGTTWTVVVDDTGYPDPYVTLQRFPFASTTAQYIRVTSTTLTQDDDSNYYFQLTQLAAF